MDAAYLPVATGSISAFFLALIIAGQFANRSRVHRVQQRAGTNSLMRLLQEGIPLCRGFAQRLIAFPFVHSYIQQTCLALEQYGIASKPQGVLSVLVAACALVLAALVWVSAPLALLASIGVVVFVGMRSKRALEIREERIRSSLPDALQAMSSCFGAGFTLLQTFEHLAHEIQGPLGALFDRAASALRTGDAPTQVLARIRCEAGVAELSFVAVALAVQHQSGGSMQRVLDATRESLKEELELRQSLQVHTAQAKLSARVVVGVTLGLVAAMLLLSRDFLQPFLQSGIGLAFLGLAIAMQITGIALVRRLLHVEVGL